MSRSPHRLISCPFTYTLDTYVSILDLDQFYILLYSLFSILILLLIHASSCHAISCPSTGPLHDWTEDSSISGPEMVTNGILSSVHVQPWITQNTPVILHSPH